MGQERTWEKKEKK